VCDRQNDKGRQRESDNSRRIRGTRHVGRRTSSETVVADCVQRVTDKSADGWEVEKNLKVRVND